MNNLNWLGMWKWLKKGASGFMSVAVLLYFGQWLLSLFTPVPAPFPSVGKAIVMLAVLITFVISGCFVALLSKKSHPSN